MFPLTSLLALLACSQAPGVATAPQRLVVTGSSTVAPLVSEIARRFESSFPGTRVDVQTGGSSRGVADAASGLAGVGMASRGPRADDPEGLVFTTLAIDGIALVVHGSNPVPSLSREQVVAVYTGASTDWGTVGGAPGPITVVHKAEGRSTLELFLAFYKLDAPAVKPSVVIGDNEQGIKTVAGNPGALGYVSVGAATYNRDHGVPIRLLPLEGVEPSITTVADGSYALSRPLSLVTRGEPLGLAASFIGFACDEAQADLVTGQYFVPVDGPDGG